MRLWTDADLPDLNVGETERVRARTASELSNLVRYEILSRHGGIYVDTDVECRRSFKPVLHGIEAFAGLELPGRVGTAVLGAVPGHSAFTRAAHECRATLGLGAHSPDANGPYFLSLIFEQEPGVRILAQPAFYPYLWTEPERSGDSFPDAYAVHHWAGSWIASYSTNGS
jgi:mannosyltransferase OCH1-like enzyme